MAGMLTFIETDDNNAYVVRGSAYNILPIAGGEAGDNRPITAIMDLDDGRMVAGVYNIAFTTVSPGVSGVVTVDTADANNPWKTSAKAVYLDDDETTSGDGTMHADIVGGVGLYFSDSVNFSVSWAASVIVGGYFASGVATQVSSFGSLRAGEVSPYKKIGAKNTGDASCTGCAVGIYPGVYFKNTTNAPIYKVKVTDKATTGGKYVISTTDIVGSNLDVYVAQYLYNYGSNTWDVVTASTLKGTFAYDGTTVHTTIISGVNIILSSTIAGDASASIYVDAVSGAQISPDVGGSPGTWVSTSDVVLTESGGVSGVVQPGNTAYFWLRIVSSVSDSPGNLRRFLLRPSGISGGELIE